MRYMKKVTSVMAVLGSVIASMGTAGPLDDAFTAQLLPGWRAADGRHMAALEINLAPGWKTYWRAPGDAGIPPQFDWRGSSNVSQVSVIWPTPDVMNQGGMQVIGYGGKLIVPLQVHPKSRARNVNLTAEINIGVCKDVCLPVSVKVDQVLSRTQTKPDAKIAGALANQPYSEKEARVGQVTCAITPIEDGLRLTAEVEMPTAGGREVAVIETGNAEVWVSQAKTQRQGARLTAVSELYHVEGRSFALDRSDVRITVLGSSHAVDIKGCDAG